jgi:hypothetical protein
MTKILVEPTLDLLFDSPIRTRVLKLFLYGADQDFDSKLVAKKLNIKSEQVRRQLKDLVDLKFIIQKNSQGNKVYKVNQNFVFYNGLKELIAKVSPASKQKMLERIKNLGSIKLAIISGVFVNSDVSRADLLVVGDRINQTKFGKFLKDLEAESGREIDYALMTTKEFHYRYDMYDRFLRDMLELKHEKLINKLKF